jgi:hypothetical protein
VNSKYDKYSTEQLEVIFTHLTDPAEKELVKKELSARYYQHYLDVGNTGNDQAPAAELTASQMAGSAGAASSGEPEGAGDGDEAGDIEDEDLAGLGEIEPIQLFPPAATEAAPAAPAPEKTTKRKYCFIATAAYGSPLAREVILLQNYRDEYLTGRWLGEKFIHAYYRFSPPLARQLGRNIILQRLTRGLLSPLILLIKKTTGARRAQQ